MTFPVFATWSELLWSFVAAAPTLQIWKFCEQNGRQLDHSNYVDIHCSTPPNYTADSKRPPVGMI